MYAWDERQIEMEGVERFNPIPLLVTMPMLLFFVQFGLCIPNLYMGRRVYIICTDTHIYAHGLSLNI